jgi:ubiquinone/menaquinone biosynthesis C-methylase UbiE
MSQEQRRGTSSDELGIQGLVDLAVGYQRAQVLFAANSLGVFQALSAGPRTAEEVAAALGVSARGLAPLLDACVALKVLRGGAGGYESSMTARLFLTPGRQACFGPVLRFWQRFSYGTWGRLEEAVRSGQPQTATGPKAQDLFEDLIRDPEQTRLFFDGLAGLAYWPARKLAELAPFDRRRHLLDLGGGSGAFSAAIALRHPHLRVTLFDLEPVCALARERFAQAGLDGRAQAVAGDFHRGPLPADVDCVLLSNVLHDWPADSCAALLARAHDVLPPGGEVLVYEVGAAAQPPRLDVSLFSLALLLDTNRGQAYGPGEMSRWLREAGFRPSEEQPVTEGTYLLRAIKESA